MNSAARAIILNGNKILVMERQKNGHIYYTLVGGRIDKNETPEQALKREVKEETGLNIVKADLVYFEDHPKPYATQYTFLCSVESFENIALEESSEEAELNKLGINIHDPQWIDIKLFPKLPFRTVQLQQSIVRALKEGFPKQPIKI